MSLSHPRNPLPALVVCACWAACAGVAFPQTVQVMGALARQYSLPRGGETRDAITVKSISDQPVQVKVYQTEYTYGIGHGAYGEVGTNPRSNATWITYTPQTFEVAPGTTTEIQFTVKVPDDEHLQGTYWSMLMVEPQAPLAPVPVQGEQTVIGIQSTFRYGIQLATTVAGTGTPGVKFLGRRVFMEDQVRRLELDVENSGDLFLRPFVLIEFRNPTTGKRVRTYWTRPAILYPGCAVTYKFNLSKLKAGTYDAYIVADNSDENVFATRCSLDLP